jgi:hypothetical protein
VPFGFPHAHTRSALITLAAIFSFGGSARAQTVLGYGEDATAAPSGAIRVRLSNDWHRSRSIGEANDTSYDSDRQYRASSVGLELGVLKRFSIGVSAPWVSTKAVTFVSSQHTVKTTPHDTVVLVQKLVLDTLLDKSHNGWGNIEALAKIVWLGEPGQQARLEPRDGVHIRSALAAGALLGTGIQVDPTDPFSIGTSDRARVLLARSATDVTVGRHFFGSLVARYEKPMADNVLVAVHPSGDPLVRDAVAFTAARQLGTKYEIEVTPRYQFGRYFAAGLQYRYHHGAQDQYTGQTSVDAGGSPVVLDASSLDAGTAITEQRVGFGVVYSAVEGYTRRRSRIPVEVTFEYSRVMAISNELPKEYEVMFAVRIFHRLWGAEFAPPPVAPKQPTLEPPTP